MYRTHTFRHRLLLSLHEKMSRRWNTAFLQALVLLSLFAVGHTPLGAQEYDPPMFSENILEARIKTNIVPSQGADFCAACQCCDEGQEISWSSVSNANNPQALSQFITAVPTLELKAVLLHELEIEHVLTGKRPHIGENRSDICEICHCCIEGTMQFDWSIVEKNSVALDSIQRDWRILTRPEVDSLIRAKP